VLSCVLWRAGDESGDVGKCGRGRVLVLLTGGMLAWYVLQGMEALEAPVGSVSDLQVRDSDAVVIAVLAAGASTCAADWWGY